MQLLAATCSLLALASMASCRAIGPRAGFDHKFYEIPCLETHASNGRPGTNPNTTISCKSDFYPLVDSFYAPQPTATTSARTQTTHTSSSEHYHANRKLTSPNHSSTLLPSPPLPPNHPPSTPPRLPITNNH